MRQFKYVDFEMSYAHQRAFHKLIEKSARQMLAAYFKTANKNRWAGFDSYSPAGTFVVTGGEDGEIAWRFSVRAMVNLEIENIPDTVKDGQANQIEELATELEKQAARLRKALSAAV